MVSIFFSFFRSWPLIVTNPFLEKLDFGFRQVSSSSPNLGHFTFTNAFTLHYSYLKRAPFDIILDYFTFNRKLYATIQDDGLSLKCAFWTFYIPPARRTKQSQSQYPNNNVVVKVKTFSTVIIRMPFTYQYLISIFLMGSTSAALKRAA